MVTKLSSLSLLAGIAALALPSTALAGGSDPGGGVTLNCGLLAGVDVNASCEVDVTKATLSAAVGASCSVGKQAGEGVSVDVDALIEQCKATADVGGALTSTLQALADCKAQVSADLKAELEAKIEAAIKALVDEGKLSVDAAAALKALVHAQIDLVAAAKCEANLGLAAALDLEARLEALCTAKADAHVAALGLLSCDVSAAADLALKASAACSADVKVDAALQCNGALALGVDVDLALDLDLDGKADVGIDILAPGKSLFANGFLNVDTNADGLVDLKLPVAISAVAGVAGGVDAPKLSASVDVDGDAKVDLSIELAGGLKSGLDIALGVDVDASLCVALNADLDGDAKVDVSALGLDLDGNGKIDTAVSVKTASGGGTVAPPAADPGGPVATPEAPAATAGGGSSDGGCSTAPVGSGLNANVIIGAVIALLGGIGRRRNRA